MMQPSALDPPLDCLCAESEFEQLSPANDAVLLFCQLPR
jgi:hypothetical protein